MASPMIVRCFVANRPLLTSMEDHPPRRGDEVCIDGRTYLAARVVRHLPMCPPDHVNVHLVMSESEALVLGKFSGK